MRADEIDPARVSTEPDARGKSIKGNASSDKRGVAERKIGELWAANGARVKRAFRAGC
jgi:hypothetical protein